MQRCLLTVAVIVGIVTYFHWLLLASPPALLASESEGELRIGNTVVSRIVEREGAMMTVPAMYPGHTAREFKEAREWLTPFVGQDDQLVFAIQTLVVRTNQSLILVETGVGLGKEREHENSPAEPNYLRTLRRLGHAPEDVDFVINTHLHRDHIGWNTRRRNGRWVPTFPHATYVFPRADWEYWKDKDDPMVEENIRPLMATDQVFLIDADQSLDKETRIEMMPGNTPGHFVVHLESHGQHAVISGDILHHPLQTAFPDWVPGFDVGPTEARDVRRRFLRTYADTETLVIPAHFPGHPGGLHCNRQNCVALETTKSIRSLPRECLPSAPAYRALTGGRKRLSGVGFLLGTAQGRHSRESGNPVIPHATGQTAWMPAYAGMTAESAWAGEESAGKPHQWRAERKTYPCEGGRGIR